MSSVDASKIFRVDDLVAVITGGGSGIGLMMTKALALNGAHKVYIIGRRLEVLEEATKESPHGNIIPIVGDVTSKSSLEAVVKQIEGEVGYINVLIANSGIAGPQSKPQNTLKSIDEFRSEMWKLSFEEFTNTFHVNTTAVFFTTIAFLGLLDAGNKRKNVEQLSQVIATSSIAGFSRQPPGGYAYGLSKAACTHLVKQLATTLVPYDIRANALAPGCKHRQHMSPRRSFSWLIMHSVSF